MFEYHYHDTSNTYYRRHQLGPARWQMFVPCAGGTNLGTALGVGVDRSLRGYWEDVAAPPDFDDIAPLNVA